MSTLLLVLFGWSIVGVLFAMVTSCPIDYSERPWTFLLLSFLFGPVILAMAVYTVLDDQTSRPPAVLLESFHDAE